MEVHSQTEYPYVSFMGETLPNHAYVDLSLVGNDDSGSDSVQCSKFHYSMHVFVWLMPTYIGRT